MTNHHPASPSALALLADQHGLSSSLPPEAALQADATEFLPLAQLREWHADLDGYGNRPTGSDAHESYVTALHERLTLAGVSRPHFEATTLRRWSTDTWRLGVEGGRELPTAGPIPSSGTTPDTGIQGPLAYLALGQQPGPHLQGQIVVFDVPTVPMSGAFYLNAALRHYDPRGLMTPETPYVRPWVAIEYVKGVLNALQAVGAAGAVAILDAPMETAQGTYFPYDRVIRQVPGVFVDQAGGAELRTMAALGGSVHLTLPAQVEDVQTRNLIGMIPGASDELVVLTCHTDGTNGLEDNGPNAIVDIAQYLTRLPQAALPRSVMLLLTTGHFANGIGIEALLKAHAEDGLLSRIAAVVEIEHLGAQEWLPDAQGFLQPTGQDESCSLFTSPHPVLVDAAEAFLHLADAAPGFVMPPLTPQHKGQIHESVWPGEGQYFWSWGDLPTINYITGPTYLLSAGISTVDKVNYDRMHRETVAFTQLILNLTRVPFSQLRSTPPS